MADWADWSAVHEALRDTGEKNRPHQRPGINTSTVTRDDVLT
jgi:hypothetical protein